MGRGHVIGLALIGVPAKVIYLHGTSSVYSVCLSVVLVAFGFGWD